MVEFANPTAALGQGLLQGADLGMKLYQQKQAQREQEWQRGTQRAMLAMKVAETDGLPNEMKAKALNNGLVPIWNDKRFNLNGNNDAPLEPFTAESFEDKDLMNTVKETQKLLNNKDMASNPKLAMDGVVNIWMEYNAKKGKAIEAQELTMGLFGADKSGLDPAARRGGGRAGLSSFSPANLIAYRNQLGRQLEATIPGSEEESAINTMLQDIDAEVELRRTKGGYRPASVQGGGTPAPAKGQSLEDKAAAELRKRGKQVTPESVKAVIESGLVK